VLVTEELSRSVIEAADQRPATLKDMQELAIVMQTRLLELNKVQSIGSLQQEITKKSCRFQIREEGTKLNSATQNAIGYALARLLNTTPRLGDNDNVPKLKIKQVFAVCCEKFCSTPIGRLIDEGVCKERAMLAQAEATGKAPFAKSQW
jgi:hypothetical protein